MGIESWKIVNSVKLCEIEALFQQKQKKCNNIQGEHFQC